MINQSNGYRCYKENQLSHTLVKLQNSKLLNLLTNIEITVALHNSVSVLLYIREKIVTVLLMKMTNITSYTMNLKRQFFVYFIILIVDEVIAKPPTSLLAGRKYCGYQHTDDYIRTHENISIDEFPWMAQLLYDEDLRILCGGSLINTRYVLTAAHCLKPPRDTTVVKVRLGDYNVHTEQDCTQNGEQETECSDPVQIFNVEEKILHPSYNRISSHNDIGLIRLSSDVHYSDYIRPICLPIKTDSDLKVGEQLLTSGWGQIDKGLPSTDFKKRIKTTLISNMACLEILGNTTKPVTDDHLCAIETESLSCIGDSGSPLMNSVRNQWEAVGIVSFGRGCGHQYPTVYTKVAHYLDWIDETLRS